MYKEYSERYTRLWSAITHPTIFDVFLRISTSGCTFESQSAFPFLLSRALSLKPNICVSQIFSF